MKSLQVFQSNDFGEIRTMNINDEPWFVGKDVAAALGYGNENRNSKALANAIVDHVESEDRRLLSYQELKGYQNGDLKNISKYGMVAINESGLYSLIMSSQLPSAKKFKRWVTSEVLPAIRKNGAYQAPGYQPKATSVGEVVNLINMTRHSMKEQGCDPREIAIAIKEICDQFNIHLPDCFIKPKETTMNDAMDMIDFIYSQPQGKGHKKISYDDFIIQTSIRRLNR